MTTLGNGGSPAADSVLPVNNNLYVNGSIAVTGNGSSVNPFKTVTEAVTAAANEATINVAKGQYGGEAAIAWTDKRISFVGNGVSEPSLHETVLPVLNPQTSGPAMALELTGVSATVVPVNSIFVFVNNSAVDAQGAGLCNYNVAGGGFSSCALTNSTGPGAISGLSANASSIGGMTTTSSVNLIGCDVTGNVNFGLGLTAKDTDFNGVSLSFGGSGAPLNIDVSSLVSLGTINNTPVITLVDNQAPNPQVLYWNFAGTVPLTHQNGQQDAPFCGTGSLQRAVTAAGVSGSTIICMGEGSAAEDATFDGAGINNTLNFISQQGNTPRTPCVMGTLTLQNHCHVSAQGLLVTFLNGDVSRLWSTNCSYGALLMTAGNVRLMTARAQNPGDTSNPWSCGVVDVSNGGTLAAFGMKLAGHVIIGGGTATVENCLQNCELSNGAGSLIVANAGTVVWIDQETVDSARRNGFDLTTSNVGILNNLDHPWYKGIIYAVGVLAAAFTDVNVAISGGTMKPGDTFDVTTTTRLANVGIVDAWSPAAGEVTLRFFGTTAGGNVTVNINQNTNSGD